MYKHKKVNKDFFKYWTPEMAYILGFIFADGNISINKRGAHYLAFYSMDKDILCFVKKSMRSEHKISKRNARSGNVYRIQIGSKEIIKDLLNLGLDNSKTKRMQLPQIPKKYRSYFILGFFDGDGNVWTGEINKKRAKPTLVIQTAFTSASRDFLNGILQVLKELGISGGFVYKIKNKNCYRLIFSIQDSLKLYKIMYNGNTEDFSRLLQGRKRKVFEKYKSFATVAQR